ncbi:MAG: tetratricopeptide repeat protein [Anaerolineales bacterium]
MREARQRLAYRAAIAGKWETAEEHWREAAGAEGGSFRLAYNLALAYERSEDFHKAGETWREALRRRPRRADHPDAITGEQIALLWKRSAEAYRSAGDYDEAVHVYKQAVKYNPDNLDTRLELSEMLVVAGRIQAAQNELDRVIQRDPDNITALLRQGELHVANASWWRGFQAPKYWRRVLEIDPDNLQARQLLADFYIDQARNNISWANYGAAIPNYQKALEYLPKNGVAMAGIGHCYLQLRNEPQAQFWFDRALETTPANLQVYDEIIHAWLDAKNPDQAWQVMAQAESHIPSIPHDFYQTQAAYCLELNRSDWARPWLKRAVETAPPGANVLVKIGEMAVMLDAHEIAKEYLDRAIKAGQYPGQAYLMLGIMHAKQNDLKTAEKHWSEAEKIAHKNRDNELTERIEIARTIFTGPQGFFDLLMRGLGPPGFNPFEDFDPFGNEDEYDDYW